MSITFFEDSLVYRFNDYLPSDDEELSLYFFKYWNESTAICFDDTSLVLHPY